MHALASNSGPIAIRGKRNISDRQGTPREHLLVLVRLQRVHTNSAILGARDEELILFDNQRAHNPAGSIPLHTVAATAVLFS